MTGRILEGVPGVIVAVFLCLRRSALWLFCWRGIRAAAVRMQSEAFVNCSDKQVFPPDTVDCLGVVKEGHDGLLRLGSLVSVTDRLREAQDLVLA